VVDRVVTRLRSVPPLVADALLAVVVAAVTLIAIVIEDRDNNAESVTTLGWVLLIIEFVPLVWRRRWPVAALVITGAASLAYGIASLPDPPLMFAALLTSYTVAAHSSRKVAITCALITVFVVAPIALVFSDEVDAADIAVNYFAGITAYAVGGAMRSERERAAWLEERRVGAEQRAAAEERTRIARELHDVVAHHVSVIAVQAEAAQEVLAKKPERAQQAMADVAETARRALAELRRLLTVLRSDGGAAPQPDLEALDDLVDSVRRAGLDVTVHEQGAPRRLDAAVGLTAYRVVQESLTNVIKHAAARRAEVQLTYDDSSLTVIVSDDGAGVSSARVRREGQGQGLVGMRERVAVLGGSLEAGPAPSGGFAVRARIPLDA
jgi:signal transduction histidine kinase